MQSMIEAMRECYGTKCRRYDGREAIMEPDEFENYVRIIEQYPLGEYLEFPFNLRGTPCVLILETKNYLKQSEE